LTTGMVGQLLVFLVSAQTVGRARPAVPHLDHDPPTASFPSGHTSASVVLYGTLADLAGRFLPSRVAGVVRPICWTVPPLVAAARVYRGMHHASDVLAGFGSGLVWLQLTRSGPE
jgi:undecaprenyl-diphosphatase